MIKDFNKVYLSLTPNFVYLYINNANIEIYDMFHTIFTGNAIGIIIASLV